MAYHVKPFFNFFIPIVNCNAYKLILKSFSVDTVGLNLDQKYWWFIFH